MSSTNKSTEGTYLTLNRAQGQPLKRAGLYLPISVFSHGHLYAGFSRCGDPDKVFVYGNQKEFDNNRHLLEDRKTYTQNVVYDKTFSYNKALTKINLILSGNVPHKYHDFPEHGQ